jgi:type III restriction enzyme
VVVVDESHNAESELSIEMLKVVNPCFILDLTATPRKNSNIISFVDSLELKRENMVKLPVIVYNHQDKTEVIYSALQLQKQLEAQAQEEEKRGGRYIRPIVLFQAQPKNADDNTTFEKLKEKLVELMIPAEQIRIKTANLNEIRNENLLSRDCPVRYIITVNALKEGWDCPFAYILASLADKNSAVDVEQILGRVLRQPYVVKHTFPLLNVSYVLTASARFMETPP